MTSLPRLPSALSVFFTLFAMMVTFSLAVAQVHKISRVKARRRNQAVSEIDGAHFPGYVGDLACRSCHRAIADAYLTTAHHFTSRLPSASSIAGSFVPGSNVLRTSNPYLYFSMQSTPEGFFESAVEQLSSTKKFSHTERIDLVVGSGRKGQTYLFWKDNKLFELPVSYWTELKAWINSPGYPDGSPRFDKPVVPRCLECHGTSFEAVVDSLNEYKKTSLTLGITCEKCHGPGREHVTHRSAKFPALEKDILNPATFSRARQIDVCALCHSGAGTSLAPVLSFVPGKVLDEYVLVPNPGSNAPVDVHGNQVELLSRSRCFKSSNMTCTTCHDVHQPQREAAAFSKNCLTCHKAEEHPKINADITSNCVDCHMPLQESQMLISDTNGLKLKPLVRNHQIAIYPTHP